MVESVVGTYKKLDKGKLVPSRENKIKYNGSIEE